MCWNGNKDKKNLTRNELRQLANKSALLCGR